VLIVLDKDFQVVWTWMRSIIWMFTVARSWAMCAPDSHAQFRALDWLHANSIARTPGDGNLLISVRHQAWVIKIDYRRGSGDGHIIWRLGKDGDLRLTPRIPAVVFLSAQCALSQQEDAASLRQWQRPLFRRPELSQPGQTWTIDEKTMTATPKLNIDLGISPTPWQRREASNGNFIFTSGSQNSQSSPFGQSIEVLPDGTKEYVLEGAALLYRSYRMTGLYQGIRR